MFPRLGTITDRLTKGLKAKLNRINVVKLLDSKPAIPAGARMMNHVLYPSKVGVAGWRHAVFPANIFFQVLAPQSLMLNGGLATAKSARKSLWRSLWNVSASCDPKLASIPRSARFIFASFQVVGFDSCP